MPEFAGEQDVSVLAAPATALADPDAMPEVADEQHVSAAVTPPLPEVMPEVADEQEEIAASPVAPRQSAATPQVAGEEVSTLADLSASATPPRWLPEVAGEQDVSIS